MSERDEQLGDFLSRAGWSIARHSNLAGDASNRRYLRLTNPNNGQSAVLMDAPPHLGEDTRPFVRIAEYLNDIGLSAPRIMAQDDNNGFLLLEDLGDDLFAKVVIRYPDLESSLYSSAIDVLIHLHRNAPPHNLETYDAVTAAPLAGLPYDWYVPEVAGPQHDSTKKRFLSLMQEALASHAADCDVLIQRDYHAENLLWLPNRAGVARVGLLDFQDAMLGHRAYDLVSLLQDARRDVPTQVERAMLSRYIVATGQNSDEFEAAYATLGAQRNLRIIGVFARLCIRDGKPGYLKFLPRVWSLLERDLAHPALASLKQLVVETIPKPTQDVIDKIRAKCAPAQKP